MENENKNQNGRTNPWLMAGSIILAGVIIALAVIYSLGMKNSSSPSDSGSNDGPVSGLDIGEAPVLGETNAPHTIVEFADFQCPYCALFHGEMDSKIRDEFIKTGKAKMVFKTLTFVDSYDNYKDPKESFLSGIAGECAKEQGNFWGMHDAIYNAELKEINAAQSSGSQASPENNGNLNRDFFLKTAKDLGLNEGQFTSCFDSAKYKSLLDKYMEEADAAMNGKISTPTLFVDGKKISNPFDISEFEKIINQ